MKIEGNLQVGGLGNTGQAGTRNGEVQSVSIKQVETSPISQENRGSEEVFPGEKQLIDAIEKSNEGFKGSNTSLKFSVHEKTKSISVKIIDNETKEVIKEIPSEKILDMVAAMLERTGLFVDKKA